MAGFSGFQAIKDAQTAGKIRQFLFSKAQVATSNGATLWPSAGAPTAGGYAGTALNAVQCNGSTPGAIPLSFAVSPNLKFLTKFSWQQSVSSHVLMLVDRLLYYPGLNLATTSSQSLVNGVSLPRYTSGEGVMAWLEITAAAAGGGSAQLESYTNSAGTASRQNSTNALTANTPVGLVPHSLLQAFFMSLQGTDIGVRSVQSFKMTSAGGGGVTAALVLGKPLGMFGISAANKLFEVDIPGHRWSPIKIEDDACLTFLTYGGQPAQPYTGAMEVTWG